MAEENLFKKYNVQGPRYTSYPTVPYWEEAPTEKQWIAHLSAELEKAEAGGHGAAIYIHLPFCESLCTFCGCNKRITKKHARSQPYIKAVHQEWDLYQSILGRDKIPVSEVHLGGGTPTFLSSAELKDLLSPLFESFTLTDNAQLSYEADPRVTSKEHIEVLYELGFKRISLGVQDFSPTVQKAINRHQPAALVKRVTDHARATGYKSVNYDLVYGLPFQGKADITHTINTVLDHRPDRIAFYGYAHVPWVSPGQRGFTEADLPSGDEKRALYELGREMLEDAGYREIGLDHFALETDELWKATEQGTLFRNFMGYMPYHVSPMIGLGCSSISDAWTAFVQNEKDVDTYQNIVAAGRLPLLKGHQLTAEDQIIRRHILNLMTQFTTTWETAELFTNHLLEVPGKVQEFVNDNLIDVAKDRLTIKKAGRPFMRNICMVFDARLARHQPDTQLFSKTI